MLNFSEQIHENVFNYIPITFCVELPINRNGSINQVELNQFISFYNVLEANKEKVANIYNEIQASPQKPIKEMGRFPVVNKKKRNSYMRYRMPISHFVGYNLWVLKPANLNRGKGIHIFQSLHQLNHLLGEYTKGEKSNRILTFVVQKYIESPLLIDGRKFDIRVWVLLTHEMDCYLFKEGYIRTSSTKFVIDKDNIDNKYIHLTNNAIQMYAENYGEYEEGNQMSFSMFQEYLNSYCADRGVRVEKDVWPHIKNIIRKSILAVRRKLNPANRKYSFEIFGYDFIMDSDFNVWLIEVNTNPCLEESSKLLKSLLPRMIENAFKLTVDSLFPPPAQYMIFPKKVYSVSGYADDINLW